MQRSRTIRTNYGNYNSFIKNVIKKIILIPLLFFGATFARIKILHPIESIMPIQAPVPDPITIMIDPYGDVRSSGRVIGNKFESELTYACAQKLKHDIEQAYDHVTIVMSRTVGEQSYEFARAQYANRLEAKAFLSIQFFQETNPIARLFLYRYTQPAFGEFVPQKYSFLSVDQAYLMNKDLTDAWVQRIEKMLEDNELKRFEFQGIRAIPCMPLKGVLAPAVLCEIGLKSPDEWTIACAYLKEMIKTFIDFNTERQP